MPAPRTPPPAAPSAVAARRVLLVEDDRTLVRLVTRVLGPPEYEVDVAGSAAEAHDHLIDHPVDAVLLDIELPDQSGLDLLRELRARGDRTPVLILTGRDTDDDVVRGLDAGADDYLVKPVGAAVLKARLRAAWRRTLDAPADAPDDPADEGGAPVRVPRAVGVLTLDTLTLDRLGRRVTLDGRPVDLTPKEFALLEQLLLRPGDVVTRGELLDHVWHLQGDPGSNVVDAHVARLRQKLRGVGRCPEIQTVRGVGFRVSADCHDGAYDLRRSRASA